VPALNQIIEHTLYLLVLMNPVSKIFILSVLAEEFPQDAMRRLITRSTWFAWGILIVLGIGGNLLLERVFHVQVHSLKVAAGIILFFIGYTALSKGVFFEVDEKQKHTDLSLVPLASPMIAGPATITAAISLNMEHGHISASLCITLAIALNFAVMLLYRRVSQWMNQRQLMGALIRITGLVIAAISVELVLSGLEDWWRAVPVLPNDIPMK
jgi:multiple antibiotic resistance protein